MKKVSQKKAYISAIVISLITSIIVSFGIGLMVADGLTIKIVPEIGFFKITIVLLPFFFIVALINILIFIALFNKEKK